MMHRIEFMENGNSLHTFVDAVNVFDAEKVVTKIYEKLDRKIEITSCVTVRIEKPVVLKSKRLTVVGRDLRSETRVLENDD